MGNSVKKIIESEDFEEPQIFLQRNISASYRLQVLWSKHMKFDFDAVIIPANPKIMNIGAMRRYLKKGLPEKIQEYISNLGRDVNMSKISLFEFYSGGWANKSKGFQY